MKTKLVYLDAAANTPIDKRVWKAMKPYMKNFKGNASSPHDFGIKASQAIYSSRRKIADILGCSENCIYFNSGATEGNNTVIKSLALHELFKNEGKRKHIIVASTEHSSVLEACKDVESWGFKLTYITPNAKGEILPQSILKALRENTLLVCVSSVNNELGNLNNVNTIGQVAHRKGAYMMSDCTQLIGSYLDYYGGDRRKLVQDYRYVDFITFAGHKIYGPMGVGVLVTNKSLDPLISGGGQEFGLRGGSSNTAAIVGIAKALEVCYSECHAAHTASLKKQLFEKLDKAIGKDNFKLNGSPDFNNIINITFKNLHSENLANDYICRGIAVSAGSACDNNHNETEGDFNPSHVLKAIKLSDDDIKNTIRISFLKNTSYKDINTFIKVTKEIYNERVKNL